MTTTAEPPEPPREAPRPPRRASGDRKRDLQQGFDVAFGPAESAAAPAPVDRLLPFAPAILAIRWGTTVMGVALAGPALTGDGGEIPLFCGLIVAYTVLRTLIPLRYEATGFTLAQILFEVAFSTAAVATTDQWGSPFVFSLVAALIISGFAAGFWLAIPTAVISSTIITVTAAAGGGTSSEDLRLASEWTLVVILVAVVAAYARRITGLADRQQSVVLDRIGRLADANALLYSLHRITQTLPASLDMDGALDTTMTRLRTVVDVDAAAILLFDETDGQWQVARSVGSRLPARLGPTELPPPLRRALAEGSVVSVGNLLGPFGPGLNARTSSGLYATLESRGEIIGLLAIEHPSPDHYESRAVDLLTGFIEPVALSIDNARWFTRIRTVGADEERNRIARDLHDRIGQSLAYLAIELDRLTRTHRDGKDVGDAISQLREDVRGVVREVRETLYDLRTDVSDDQDVSRTLHTYASRVEERSGLDLDVRTDSSGRLPILQEREMWRIAQEALTNVERHADADNVNLHWSCDGTRALLEISDDGRGFEMDESGRIDSYGLMGMRERASSIGALLEIHSTPGEGTTIRCSLAPSTAGDPRIPARQQTATGLGPAAS